jgi:peptidoglycan/LPS O-acetylase OafA/YrhL
MSTIPLFLIAWAIHLLVAAVVVAPVVVFTRNRVNWRFWELLALVLPFCIWLALMLSDRSAGSKSLSNFVVEPGILAATVAIGALARGAISRRISDNWAFGAALAGICAAAALVFRFVPTLPE